MFLIMVFQMHIKQLVYSKLISNRSNSCVPNPKDAHLFAIFFPQLASAE